MKWFRSYHSDLNDPTLRELSNAEYGIYCKLKCLIAQQPKRDGFVRFSSTNIQTFLGKILGIDRKTAEKSLNSMQRLDLVKVNEKENWIYSNRWKDEQKPSGDVASRVRKHRQKQAECNVTVTPQRSPKSSTKSRHKEGIGQSNQKDSIPLPVILEEEPQLLEEIISDIKQENLSTEQIDEYIAQFCQLLESEGIYNYCQYWVDDKLEENFDPATILYCLIRCYEVRPDNPKGFCERLILDHESCGI
jgi:hypothetical protein